MSVAEASAERMKGRRKSGYAKTGAETRYCLRALKAEKHAGYQMKGES